MPSIILKEVVIRFDAIDWPLVDAHAWYLNPQGYACTKIRRADGTRRSIGMHRLILGDPAKPCVDHINRDQSDNRRANLRACSWSTNNRNRPTSRDKTSRFRGVSKRGEQWQVVVRVSGKLKWLGTFDRERDAGRVASAYFAGIAP